MNIILKIKHIFEDEILNRNTLFFLDTKQNMIIPGEFTKILYSDDLITLNGLYLDCPLFLQPVEKFNKKNTIWFQPYHIQNTNVIQQFSNFEKELLEYYKQHTGSNKTLIYSIHNQLYSGNAKIYTTFSNSSVEKKSERCKPLCIENTQSSGTFSVKNIHEMGGSNEKKNNTSTVAEDYIECTDFKYIIKISGIWESEERIGVTYKFIKLRDLCT
jgi:hypothetical protein